MQYRKSLHQQYTQSRDLVSIQYRATVGQIYVLTVGVDDG